MDGLSFYKYCDFYNITIKRYKYLKFYGKILPSETLGYT